MTPKKKMNFNISRFNHVANVLTILSGVIYGILFFLPVDHLDPYSSARHPLIPAAQSFHILVSPLLIFAIGLIWNDHVWKKFRSPEKKKRLSGIGLALLFIPLTASGYFLQVFSNEIARQIAVAVHWVGGCAWIVSGIFHFLRK